MVQFDAKLRLPTALELPDSDETPVDNELQISIAGVLRAILSLIWQNRQDWFFGIDMGVFADTEASKKAIVPDGFLSLGVPRFKPNYGDAGRPSYVLWEEDGIMPKLVLEVVSKTYHDEYEKKFQDYQTLEVPYYVVYDPEAFQPIHQRLEIYQLINNTYVLMSGEPVWLPEIGLGIGRSRESIQGWEREWLFWFSEEGERYPVPEEFQRLRAEVAEFEAIEARSAASIAERIAEQERQAKEQEQQARLEAVAELEVERQRNALLVERLRALGIDLDNL